VVDLVGLKSGGIGLIGPGRVVPAAQADAVLEAEQILTEARRRAAEMLAGAREETEAIRAAARAAGMEAATEDIQDRLFAIAEASANAIARAEERIIEMGLQIARRIIGSFDEADIAARVAKKSVTLSANSSFVRLRVAPAVTDSLRERLESVLPPTMASVQIEVIGDDRVRGGGCIMETDAGLIDATVESQIAAIERGLRRSLVEVPGRDA